MKLITYDQVKSKIIEIRNQQVILDTDIAGVEAREINQAVKRNLAKFPDGYLMELTADEWEPLKSQSVTSIKYLRTSSRQEAGIHLTGC